MLINFIISLTFICIGAYIGNLISFLNNDDRIPNIKELIVKRSKCQYCQTKFNKIETIPIISFIVQKGLCPYCSKKLSIEQLVLEILCANLFGISYFIYGFSLKYIFAILIIISILAIYFIDIKYMVVPIYLQVYLGFCAVLFILFNPIDPLFSIFCSILYYIIICLCVVFLKKLKSSEFVGDADKVLFSICGLILRLENLPKFLIITGLSGIMTFYLFRNFNRNNDVEKFPFVPAILISLLICLISL